MGRVVVLTGGVPHAHDFESIGTALAGIIGPSAELVDHPDQLVGALADDVDVLVVDALFWRMVGEVYEPWRDAWAYSPPESTRIAITDHVRGGGGLVALHTTSICFDDWPEWGEIVGGSWQWGISSHPPAGPVEARVVAAHPITAGIGPVFEVRDEVYGDQRIRADVEVLAVAKRTADDTDQPVLWAHQFGRGRVVYHGFGHDSASIEHPTNVRILTQAISWVRRET